MASGGGEKKKPVKYFKSKIPIASTEYKGLLRQVKAKKLDIEDKEAEVSKLKADFENLKIRPESGVDKEVRSAECGNIQGSSTLRESKKTTLRDHSSGYLRTVIRTPGGTKRKVKPSHVQFRFELEEALSEIVEVSESSLIKTEELIQILHKKYPASRHIDRRKILTTVSEVYNKKVERRGKKKEGYYSGLAFTVQSHVVLSGFSVDGGSAVVGSSTSSPLSKSSRPFTEIEVVQETSPEVAQETSTTCRGRLNFSVPSETMDDMDVLIDDEEQKMLKEKVKDLEKKKLNELQDTASQVIDSQSEVIEMLKALVGGSGMLGGSLTLTERNAITSEVIKAKSIFNLGIRTGNVTDIEEIINPLLFCKLLERLKSDCPTITNTLEQLVLSRNASRNVRKTQWVKMKATVHLLSSILDVRDQNAHNDVQLLFGTLCVTYGARSSMIEVLQHIGLSESFPVICSVLKKQLLHYKEIISARVSPACPVVTYQDNLQIHRTTMRHLRLSKLQKDKKKQDKFWDFTVRGWRACDVSGIEELFKDEATAKQPQRNIADLKFDDLNIECHKDQHNKWVDFKERNLLRKLDLTLNYVPLNAEELSRATPDQLRKVCDTSLESCTVAQYRIDIPPVPEEFTQSSEKSAMYPLPITIENQCTTLGLASNLDKFTEEFGFVSGSNSGKFLPLKKGKEEFNLELAYERYAFLKSMEVHRQEQDDYEQFLRNSVIETNQTVEDN